MLSLFFAALAVACPAEPIPQTTPAPAAHATSPATVAFTLEGNVLKAHFEVKSASIYGKPRLGPNQFPYMFDVAEVFVSAEGGVPYYEFEITPFDQTFQVRVYYPNPTPGPNGEEPRKAFQNGVDVGLEHHAAKTPTGWTADLAIPLERIGWHGDAKKITGNAFVILGKSPNRKFHSRSLPVQDRANFHMPRHFKPLLCE